MTHEIKLPFYHNKFIKQRKFKEQKWPQEDVSNVRNKGSNYPLISHRDATLKQILNRARPTAQRLASSVRGLTGTLQSHPLCFLHKQRKSLFQTFSTEY